MSAESDKQAADLVVSTLRSAGYRVERFRDGTWGIINAPRKLCEVIGALAGHLSDALARASEPQHSPASAPETATAAGESHNDESKGE